MNDPKPINQRTASLFRNGRNQAVRIPVEFELPGDEVLIWQEDGRLVIEPKSKKPSMAEFLASLEAFPDFPDIDDGNLPPLRDVKL